MKAVSSLEGIPLLQICLGSDPSIPGEEKKGRGILKVDHPTQILKHLNDALISSYKGKGRGMDLCEYSGSRV